MVEGTGLENQRWKHPQVRILSFPPNHNLDIMSRLFYTLKMVVPAGIEPATLGL